MDNKVLLDGIVKKLQMHQNKNGNTERVDILLTVARRSEYVSSDRKRKPVFEDIPVLVHDTEQIKYLLDMDATEGDFVSLYGEFVLSAEDGEFCCDTCGGRNVIKRMKAYVIPINITVISGYPWMTEEMLKYAIIEGIQHSDKINIFGTLISDPCFFKNENGKKTILYEICSDVNGVEEPHIKEEDCVFIKSVGKQAETDALCLRKSSLILVSGSLHAIETLEKRHCIHCGAECTVADSGFCIIAKSVKYLVDCDEHERRLPLMSLSDFIGRHPLPETPHTENSSG